MSRDVIAQVIDGAARPFVCQRCGSVSQALITVNGAVGRLPANCEVCDPHGPTWQRERAERPLRSAIVELQQEVTSLRAAATAGQSYTRGRKYGPPSRESVARAAKRVALATGATGTREALLDLAAAAQAWAWTLSSKDDR
jgi:transcription elongation factor Elf1